MKSLVPGAGPSIGQDGRFQKVDAWERFVRFTVIDDAMGCWRWRGGLDQDGYGNFHDGKKYISAHKYAYQQIVGSIPEGLVIDHLCRVRHCVNPFHMEVVTNHENIRRGEVAARERAKKACPRGHAYDTITSEGKRRCKRCHAAAAKRSRDRKKT